MRILILCLSLLFALPALAVQPDEVLSDPGLESRARAISKVLRCPVCQGETIDESNAPISRDLRLYLRERLVAGDTDAQVVGKWAHYVHIGDETGPTLLRFEDSEHRYVRLVQGGTILTPREVALATRFEDLPRRVDTTFLEKIHAAGGRVYSTDRWNFVSVRGADPGAHTWKVSHEELLARSSRLVFNGDAVAHVTV